MVNRLSKERASLPLSSAPISPLARGRLFVLAAGVCWSLAGAGVKLAAPLDGWQISGGRSLFAFLFLAWAFGGLRRGAFRLSPRVWALAAAYVGMILTFIISNTRTTAASAIFLQNTAPVWVAVLSPWILKEHFRWRELAVLALCVAGVACFFVGGEVGGETSGNVLALVSGVGYAIVVLGVRAGRPRERPANATENAVAGPPPLDKGGQDAAAVSPPLDKGGQGGCRAGRTAPSPNPGEPAAGLSDAEQILILGNLLCFLVCLPGLFRLPPWREAAGPVAVVAVMGVVQLGLGYFCLSHGLRQVRAVEASLLAQIEPALNPLWAYLAVGEKPGAWALLGGAIIIGAVSYLALTRDASPPSLRGGRGGR